MTNSTYEQPLSHDLQEMAASGYLPDNRAVPGNHHIYPEMAAAGLWTTASDLAKFVGNVQLSTKGKSSDVVSQAMAMKMITATIEDGVGFGFFFPDTPEGKRDYFEHGGWDEGFSAKIIGHKSKGYGVVVMINSNHPQLIDELVCSVADVYGWDDYLLPTMRSLQYNNEEINRIVGAYDYDSELVLRVYSESEKVYVEYIDFDRPRAELVKIGDNEYIRRERTNKITFVDGANGEVNFAFVNSDGTLKVLERIDTQY
jgi:CubicO group peptidase (beta-lactamase class C family)